MHPFSLYGLLINKSKKDLEPVTATPGCFPLYSEMFFIQRASTWLTLMLNKIGFKVIQEITFANLCRTYHDVLIISFFNFHFEWKSLEKENYKIYEENERKNEKSFFYADKE